MNDILPPQLLEMFKDEDFLNYEVMRRLKNSITNIKQRSMNNVARKPI
jgi:hypothetical protein